MGLFLVFFTMLFASHVSAATVYQCEKEGIAVFSQLPCGEDSKQIQIADTNIAYSAISNNKQEASTDIANYLTGQQIDSQIAENKHNIKKLQEQLNSRKIQIDYMTQDAANRLGASSINEAITQQRNKVDQLYQPQIKQQQKQIDELTALKSKIVQGK